MELYLLSALVSNHFGKLTRVTNLFSRRGYNIKELTVGETENPQLSRITIVTEGDEQLLKQIRKQLSKLHDVKAALVLSIDESVSRELLLIKFKANQELYDELRKTRAAVLDGSDDCVIVEITGETSEINNFIENMKKFDILEICRTGATALQKGRANILNYNLEVNGNGNNVL